MALTVLTLIGLALMGLSEIAEAASWVRIGLAAKNLSAVEAHPDDPDVIFAGGGPESGEGLWRSLDGGETWDPVNTGLGTPFRINVITFQPTLESLANTESYSFGVSSTVLVGAANASGPALFKTTNLGDLWIPAINGIPVDSGEITSIVFDPLDPETVYAGANGPVGGIVKSVDAGDSWVAAGIDLDNGFCTSACVLSLVIDSSNSQTLYAATPAQSTVYKTTTGGTSWSPTQSTMIAEELVIDPNDPQTLYASGTLWESGGIEKTTDGGATWVSLSNQPNLPPVNNTSSRRMVLNPTYPDSVWIAIEYTDFPDIFEEVWHTGNGGQTWSKADRGLEGVRVRDLAYSDGRILAATDDGVYAIIASPIFSDGFESGDTLQWSFVQP